MEAMQLTYPTAARIIENLAELCDEDAFEIVEHLTGFLWSEQTAGLIKQEIDNER